jgi:hypothetical protein
MSALTEIPAHFPTEFGTNWDHLCQQKDARLAGMVTMHKVNGKESSFNQMDSVEMARVTTRSGETRYTDINLAKRWLRPLPYDLATLLDEWDGEYLGQIALPQSDIVTSHGAAYSRACDDVLIAAATGSAYTGDTGTTATPLPSGQKVAVDYVESGATANSGLTVAKLRAAAYAFDANDVDPDEPKFLAVSAKQIQDLLKTTEVTSADYNTVKALVAGQIDTFMGFKFIRSQRLALDSGTGIRTCFAWVKSGIKFSTAGRSTKVDLLPTRSHSLQIRTVASLGATRTEEEKVVQISADEVL